MDKKDFYIIRSRSRKLDKIQNDESFNFAKDYLDKDHVERKVDDEALERKFQELVADLAYRGTSVMRLAAAILSETGKDESKVFVTDDVRLLLDTKKMYEKYGVIVTDIEGLSKIVGTDGQTD